MQSSGKNNFIYFTSFQLGPTGRIFSTLAFKGGFIICQEGVYDNYFFQCGRGVGGGGGEGGGNWALGPSKRSSLFSLEKSTVVCIFGSST